MPTFDYFLKDLDEVKVGVVASIAPFLRALSPEARHKYLGAIVEMRAETDNWRFRHTLAMQLADIGPLFPREAANLGHSRTQARTSSDKSPAKLGLARSSCARRPSSRSSRSRSTSPPTQWPRFASRRWQRLARPLRARPPSSCRARVCVRDCVAGSR